MRNITITVDDETARWARMEAARREVSVSRLFRDLLRERIDEGSAYDRAMEDFLAQRPRPLQRGRRRYPRRDELHERADLR